MQITLPDGIWTHQGKDMWTNLNYHAGFGSRGLEDLINVWSDMWIGFA